MEKACEPGSQWPDHLKTPRKSHCGQKACCVAVGFYFHNIEHFRSGKCVSSHIFHSDQRSSRNSQRNEVCSSP